MSPRGNRTEKRGHRLPVGGIYSKGTVQKTVRLSIEKYRPIEKKLSKLGKDFAGYVRDLIDEDLKK